MSRQKAEGKKTKQSADTEIGNEAKKRKTSDNFRSFDSKWKLQKPSLLYLGDDLPGCKKVAAFDVDGTLIERKDPTAAFASTPDGWIWFNERVPGKLKELNAEGYKIVLFTNQGMIKSALMGKAAANFRSKVDQIIAAADVPAAVFVATNKDENRKPGKGMWELFISECNEGVEVDVGSSFFVGDAAGRKYDFADSDKEFANAIGLPFKVPEDMFGEGCYPNSEMAKCLRNLAETTQASGEKNAGFKANAFRKAAGAIEAHMTKLESAKEAGKLPGVGKGVQALVAEFLETGSMGDASNEGEKPDLASSSKTQKDAPATDTKAKKTGGLAFL